MPPTPLVGTELIGGETARCFRCCGGIGDGEEIEVARAWDVDEDAAPGDRLSVAQPRTHAAIGRGPAGCRFSSPILPLFRFSEK